LQANRKKQQMTDMLKHCKGQPSEPAGLMAMIDIMASKPERKSELLPLLRAASYTNITTMILAGTRMVAELTV